MGYLVASEHYIGNAACPGGRVHRPRSARLAGRLKAFARRGPEGLRRRWLVVRIRCECWRSEADVRVQIPKGVRVGKNVRVEVGHGTSNIVRIGAGSTIGDGVRLRLRGGSIDLGENVDLRAGVVLNIGGGTLVMEGPNNLAWGVTVHCAESVHLSRHAHVAEYSTIVDSSHYYSAPDEWSYHNTRTRPVRLGVDVWVCPKATITSGVSIGDHTIVASGSVVVRDAPPGVLLSGVPAQVVKSLALPWESPD